MPADTVLEHALDRIPHHLSKPLLLGDVVPTIPSLFRFDDGKSHDGAGFFLRSLSMDGRPVRTQPMVALARSLGGVVFTKNRIVLVRFNDGSSVMGETLHDRTRFYPQPVVFTTSNLDSLLDDSCAYAQIAYYLDHPPTVATTLEEAIKPGTVWPSYLPLDTAPYVKRHGLFPARSYLQPLFDAVVNSVPVSGLPHIETLLVYFYGCSVGAYAQHPPAVELRPEWKLRNGNHGYVDTVCRRLARLWTASPLLNTQWMVRQMDQRYESKGLSGMVYPGNQHPHTLTNGFLCVFTIPIVGNAHQRMSLMERLEPDLRTAVLDA
jgi:hypothetical protein